MADPARDGHLPWEGPAYHAAGQRVLLLGESHYVTAPGDDAPTLTRDIVQAVRDGTRPLPFYTKAAQLLGGSGVATPQGRAAFWDGVAFFNYVPVVVGLASNAEPTAAMWAAAPARFFALLAALAPTHVLSLGQRQWNHIKFPAGWTSVPVANPSHHLRRWLAPDGRETTATWVNHPSSRGFSTPMWGNRVGALLARPASEPADARTRGV